jgi:hypothetical protein
LLESFDAWRLIGDRIVIDDVRSNELIEGIRVAAADRVDDPPVDILQGVLGSRLHPRSVAADR